MNRKTAADIVNEYVNGWIKVWARYHRQDDSTIGDLETYLLRYMTADVLNATDILGMLARCPNNE
jgi:hypothetical protein